MRERAARWRALGAVALSSLVLAFGAVPRIQIKRGRLAYAFGFGLIRGGIAAVLTMQIVNGRRAVTLSFFRVMQIFAAMRRLKVKGVGTSAGVRP